MPSFLVDPAQVFHTSFPCLEIALSQVAGRALCAVCPSPCLFPSNVFLRLQSVV